MYEPTQRVRYVEKRVRGMVTVELIQQPERKLPVIVRLVNVLLFEILKIRRVTVSYTHLLTHHFRGTAIFGIY